ncbi:MAG TPA: bestrophin family protein [Xenococcaceae cyanobacterium]
MIDQKKLKYQRNREEKEWFKIVTQIRCSVIPAIFLRVLICSCFSLVISILYILEFKVALPVLSSVVPSIVLGLLLVFRTNTAYERFWEGRKLWGTLVNTVRNLARQIWVSIAENHESDRLDKIAALRLLIAFAVATKLHLRSETVNHELQHLMPKKHWQKLQNMNNPPLEVAFWLGNYLQEQSELKNIDSYQKIAMFKLLDVMTDVLGGCERILKTPIPLAYSIHLKQLLLIYCFTLPFQIVSELTWWTAPIVAIISFTVFGIEEIGIEIENPFGYDINDLPLDNICRTMAINIEDLISLAPCTRQWNNINSEE